MIRADHARRTLRAHAEQLARTADDTTLPHRVDATATQADRLCNLLAQLSERFAPHPGSLPRTPVPPESTPETSEESVDDEQLLLATATGSPQTVQTMQWLMPADFTVPLYGTLWQCITGLVHRGGPLDPVIVLGEAQQAGLPSGTVTTRDLLKLLSDPHGVPDHWGEKIVRRALLHRARTVADRIVVFADDPANTPYQLITGCRRVLAEFASLHARWNRATIPAPMAHSARSRGTSRAIRAGPAPAASANGRRTGIAR
nr:DnaB-like helicase N-terminal domain-containing protein [Streptomyces anulatus]